MRRRNSFLTALGVFFVLFGVLGLLQHLGVLRAGPGAFWGILLIALGVWWLVRTFSPRHRTPYLNWFGGVTLGDEPWQVADAEVRVDSGLGDARVRLATAQIAPGDHRVYITHWLGDVRVDLTDVKLPPGTLTIDANNVAGDVVLRVPQGMPLRVRAEAQLGTVRVGEQKRDGFSPALEWESPEFATSEGRVEALLSQLLGDVRVRFV